MIDSALWYVEQGISVIPSDPHTKKPLVKWTKYREKLPSERVVRQWWKKWPDANIAVLPGVQSRVFILDFDDRQVAVEWYLLLPVDLQSTMVRSPHGLHVWYRGVEEKNPLLWYRDSHIGELKGSMPCTSPPSKNGSGDEYVWLVSLDRLITTSMDVLKTTGLKLESPKQRKAREKRTSIIVQPNKYTISSRTRYAKMVLGYKCENIMNAEKGLRNRTVYNSAAYMREYKDVLSPDDIMQTLLKASQVHVGHGGFAEEEAMAAIRNGLAM